MLSPLGARGQLCGPLGVTPVSTAVSWWQAGGASGCMGAYDAKNAASYTASKINLVNAALPLLDSAGVLLWAAGTGWSGFAGLGRYLNTQIVSADGMAMLAQFSGGSGTTMMYVAGCLGSVATTRFYLMPRYTTDTHYYGQGGNASVAGRLAAGNMGISGQQGYLNGAPDGGAIGAWTGTGTRSIYIGAYNGVLVEGFWNGAIQQVWIGPTQTAAAMLALATAMAAL